MGPTSANGIAIEVLIGSLGPQETGRSAEDGRLVHSSWLMQRNK